MMSFMFFWIPLIIFVSVVAPIWVIAHYLTRWRTEKSLTNEDEQLLSELWESVERMESRINNLERILDAEAADWRKQI